MSTLQIIEAAAKAYADSRDLLGTQVGELHDEMTRAKRAHLPGIKRRLRVVAEREAALRQLVADAAALFVKPRTLIFHGIKVGFTKGAGGVEFADAKRTVELIHKHFPEHAGDLLIIEQKPRKAAIALLLAHELKRIGATLVDTGDQLVLKAVDSEVDKLVDALLKDAVAQEEQAEAA